VGCNALIECTHWFIEERVGCNALIEERVGCNALIEERVGCNALIEERVGCNALIPSLRREFRRVGCIAWLLCSRNLQ